MACTELYTLVGTQAFTVKIAPLVQCLKGAKNEHSILNQFLCVQTGVCYSYITILLNISLRSCLN